MKQCSRCHGSIGARWEDDCNNAEITLERCSQIFNPLAGGKSACATEREFKAWNVLKDHPAFEEIGAQHAKIVWGNHKEYILCRKCHDEFIRLVGNFLNLPALVDAVIDTRFEGFTILDSYQTVEGRTQIILEKD